MLTLNFETEKEFKDYVGGINTGYWTYNIDSTDGSYETVEVYFDRGTKESESESFRFVFKENGGIVRTVNIPLMTIKRFDFLVLAELTKAKKEKEKTGEIDEPTL